MDEIVLFIVLTGWCAYFYNRIIKLQNLLVDCDNKIKALEKRHNDLVIDLQTIIEYSYDNEETESVSVDKSKLN